MYCSPTNGVCWILLWIMLLKLPVVRMLRLKRKPRVNHVGAPRDELLINRISFIYCNILLTLSINKNLCILTDTVIHMYNVPYLFLFSYARMSISFACYFFPFFLPLSLSLSSRARVVHLGKIHFENSRRRLSI